MNNKINFGTIASKSGRQFKISEINAEIERVGIYNLTITDCLANEERDGLFVMRVLHEHYKQNHDLSYHLKVLKDEKGNEVKPGDKIEWKMGMKLRDPFGRKYSQHEIKALRKRGEIRQVEIWHSAIVDEKGCITVGFEDAAHLLSYRGVHYESGMPLTNMPEVNGKGTVHYWLYQEVPTEEYKKLSGKKKSE